jgi:hypothetical protein
LENVEMLRSVEAPMELLKSFIISPPVAPDTFGLRALRFDMRSPLVKYINNIEKDSRYKDWPSGLDMVG